LAQACAEARDYGLFGTAESGLNTSEPASDVDSKTDMDSNSEFCDGAEGDNVETPPSVAVYEAPF